MKIISLFAVLILFFLMACASGATAPTPTSAPVQPAAQSVAIASDVPAATGTFTPIPPTNTPLPTPTDTATPPPTNTATSSPTMTPTDTPTPSITPTSTSTFTPSPTPTRTRTNTPTRVPTKRATATPVLTGLAAAVNRSDNTASHMETKAFYSNPYAGYDLYTATGERNSQGSHLTITGKFCGCNGAPNNTLEFINTADQSFIKGPAPAYKATEDRWYLVPPDKAQTAKSSAQKSLLSPGLTEFSQIDDQVIDGVNYHVYTINKDTARQRLKDVLGFTESELGQVVNVEVTFWVGDDGYVHQALSRMDVTDLFNPSTTDIVKFQTRYFDYGIPVQITKPADAVPLPQ